MTHTIYPAYHYTQKARGVYTFLWFACEHPTRSIDEACLFQDGCYHCYIEWVVRGCPISPLPPVPRFEDIPGGIRAICEPDGYCRDGHQCGLLDYDEDHSAGFNHRTEGTKTHG